MSERFTAAQVIQHNLRQQSKRFGELSQGLADDGPESALHDAILDECKRRGWIAVYSRMDKRTTQQKGVTDFIVAADNGKVFWIEAKAKGRKVTVDQEGFHRWLAKLGHEAFVVYSFEQFLDVIK